ncbi:hypothetical protein BH23PAT2_BH23PAT2_10530 [soil metagenome]
MPKQSVLRQILDDTRLYPSPHNSQPIKVKIKDNKTIEAYYDLRLGLPAESFGKQFGYVCKGVFLSSLRIVAAHYGYQIKEELKLTDMDFLSKERLHLFGKITFIPTNHVSDEAEKKYQSYMKRQTSRIPYDNSLVSEQIVQEAGEIAKSYGHVLNVKSDQRTVSKIIEINQKTLFLDIKNDAVYNELMEWLRFSEKQAKETSDGLSAKTMLIPGGVLKFIMKHRFIWTLPIIGSVIRSIYIRTMRGVRQVAWITGKFNNYEEYVSAGKCFMDIWVHFTKYGIYLHPYGTVITNSVSHKQFTELVNEAEDEGTMAWMLFRLGHSKKPPHSYRRPLTEMIIEEV